MFQRHKAVTMNGKELLEVRLSSHRHTQNGDQIAISRQVRGPNLTPVDTKYSTV
jgi:hypothetical protein